jgi:toxin CcdB
MPQFQVYRNRRSSRQRIPYLLDVQSDLVRIPSRLVVPLVQREHYGPLYTRLNPQMRIGEIEVVAVVSELAAIDARQLQEPVADFSSHRVEILAALDFLLTGY